MRWPYALKPVRDDSDQELAVAQGQLSPDLHGGAGFALLVFSFVSGFFEE